LSLEGVMDSEQHPVWHEVQLAFNMVDSNEK
jgi:hypothetical protein